MHIQTPDWVKHAVFYQIFPDRFSRGENVPPAWLRSIRFEDWDAPPTFQGYKGGTLWGVIEKLDYLKDLGFTEQQAVVALNSTGGNVEYAAGLLFQDI